MSFSSSRSRATELGQIKILMINYKNKYVVVIGLLLVWLLADGVNKFLHSNDDFNDASFVLFYENSLNEEISDYRTDRGMMFLHFKGNINAEYAIWPLGKKTNRIFNRIEIGDSLFKESNSEFFYLKKQDSTVFKYEISTFFKN